MKPIMIWIGCLLTWAWYPSCQPTDSDSATPPNQAQAAAKRPTVGVVHPARRAFSGTVELVGTVEPNQVVQLHAMESGYVQQINKDIGDPVRRGEVIARLENPELTRRLQRQEALMAAKASIFTRLDSLAQAAPGLVTLDEVEMAQAEYEMAQAEYEATQDRLAFLQVKSPFSGLVTRRYVDRGALIQSGTANPEAKPVVEVMEMATVRIRVPVPESDLRSIEVGTEAELRFPELDGAPRPVRVSRLSGALNPQSRSMVMELDLPNPKLAIKPGMYARVTIQLSTAEQALSVPQAALVVYQDEFFLYVVEEDTVRRRPLQRGVSNQDFFELLSPSFSETTQVIVRGKNLVEPGMHVQPLLIEDRHE